MKDLAKRKRVMARSMRLGHCICNAKKSCPCDVFQQHDVCPCAGESMDANAGPVRLMSMVQSAGCASKIDKATLGRVLEGLPFLDDPRVLVGAPAGDDAGVYRLDDDTALVQTVDVFSPSADDPYLFGQIAAANSLSDVYAMGGRPITALSIVGFPLHTVPTDVLHEILRGGIDKMTEAGVPVVGGHSINDSEIKAGFAVTGLVHPDKIATNTGARPGDCLILTKPLGTGIMTFAAQIGRAPAGGLEAAARSMAALNRDAARLMIECDAHACTDVTGFGLMGHLGAMAAASGVDVEIVWDDLPLLPGVLECLAEGIASGAVERNRESSGHCLVPADDVQPPMLDLCFDPQTSGGLLIAVPASAAGDLLGRLHAAGVTEAAAIGKVVGTGKGRVFLRTDGRRPIPSPSNLERKGTEVVVGENSQVLKALSPQPPPSPSFHDDQQPATREANPMPCCDPNHQSNPSPSVVPGGAAAAQRKFQEFLQAASAPGALDAKTKQAIAIALSVLARCEPCVKSHVKKARTMGFSQEEIDEAAWLGIAFGGSPAMVFYATHGKS
jgi:selenide, water dikinase